MPSWIPESATAEPQAGAAGSELRARRPASRAWGRFRRHRPAVVGAVVLLIFCLASLLAPVLTPYDPIKTDVTVMLARPSWSHPMGTDELGRDLLTRILYSGRISLGLGLLAMTIAVSFGTVVGALAGYSGHALDNVLMRLTDLLLAFPGLFLLILMTSLFGTGLLSIALVIGGLRWMGVARLVRAMFLSLKEREFVEAARAAGATSFAVMWRHVLPNAWSPVIVAATLGVAEAIILESSLSFLGLGIQPPTATWGNMLRSAQDQIVQAPWTAFFPGLMIFLTVLSINHIGDAARDALDSRQARR